MLVSYESIRRWCIKFGPRFRRSLRRHEGRLGDTWHADEVFIRIQGKVHYLWRAVDEDGDVIAPAHPCARDIRASMHFIEVLVQERRDAKAAKRFFYKALNGQGGEPIRLTTDGLKSYPSAARQVLPGTHHDTSQYANNRAEVSHQPTRQQERQMRRFKSLHHAQRFLALPARVSNLFRYGRHLMRASIHRMFRARASCIWQRVICA